MLTWYATARPARPTVLRSTSRAVPFRTKISEIDTLARNPHPIRCEAVVKLGLRSPHETVKTLEICQNWWCHAQLCWLYLEHVHGLLWMERDVMFSRWNWLGWNRWSSSVISRSRTAPWMHLHWVQLRSVLTRALHAEALGHLKADIGHCRESWDIYIYTCIHIYTYIYISRILICEVFPSYGSRTWVWLNAGGTWYHYCI